MLIFTAGCKSTSFVPQAQNVPLFTEKGQFRYTPSVTYRSLDADLAYSPLSHLGTMLNFQLTGNCIIPEAGAGYYAMAGNAVFECYAGYAYINKSLNDSSISWFHTTPAYRHIDIRANRTFIQPDIGWKLGDHFELAVSAKMSYWEFTKYYFNVEKLVFSDTAAELHGPTQFTIEPAITFRAGGQYVKFMVQVGGYMATTTGTQHPDVYSKNYYPMFVKVGLTVPAVIRKKKKAAGK